MAIDLHSRNFFGSTSLLVCDDRVVVLEHSVGPDRMRRVLFEQLDSVSYSSKRTILVPGIAAVGSLLFTWMLYEMIGPRITPAAVAGLFIGALGLLWSLVVLAWFLLTIRVRVLLHRSIGDLTFSCRCTPGRMRRFLLKLEQTAVAAQDQLWQARATATAAALAAEAPPPLAQPSQEYP